MIILVLNSGSSSIKYQLFDMGERKVLASGLLEQIGEPTSRLAHRTCIGRDTMEEFASAEPVADHDEGFQKIVATFEATGPIRDAGELTGIGHRVVHGGAEFQEPTLIDDQVIARIREQSALAPLHNPANLAGIEVALARSPDIPQVAVFDTAFHQTIPPHAYSYALPQEVCAEHQIRRYGFHGTSHIYVAKEAATYLHRPVESLNLISLHLGNGASVTAIEGGRSVDTSMGMSPLEGLIMGTRCGDIDPTIVFYLARKTGWSNDRIESLLNKESGLEGMCGSNDMREVERLAESGDAQARLAIDAYCYRIRKYIGMYTAVLGGVDALLFTAGIGENSFTIRAGCCQGLEPLGVTLDTGRNESPGTGVREIQSEESAVKVLVVPTNEELEIAEETLVCINAGTPVGE